MISGPGVLPYWYWINPIKNKKGIRSFLAIGEYMSRAIAAIVGLSNIANIIGSVITGRVVTVTLGNKWLGLFSGCHGTEHGD